MSPLERELLAMAWQIDLDMLAAAQTARTILGVKGHGPEGPALNHAVCALVAMGYVEFGSFERKAPLGLRVWNSPPGRTSAGDAEAFQRYLAENAATWTPFPGDVETLRRYLEQQWKVAAHPLHIGEIGWIRATSAGKREAERLGINESPVRGAQAASE